MTAKWKEVSAYTGEAVEEDAPTNNAGSGAVAMPPDAMMKKRKKKLLDARTKEYKQHQAKLEASRKRRMEQKKSKFIEKVKESLDDFNRESLLAEDNLKVLRSIVKNKQNKPVKMSDGQMKVDLYTASAITQALDKVRPDTRKKMEDIINNGGKSQFLRLVNVVFK